ncbi:hypothetical protein OAT93_02020, partial [bacterium]|nr:hypothetical protein [bacterium]
MPTAARLSKGSRTRKAGTRYLEENERTLVKVDISINAAAERCFDKEQMAPPPMERPYRIIFDA